MGAGGEGGSPARSVFVSAAAAIPTLVGRSALDMRFRRLLVLSKLFTTSWGDPRILQELMRHRRTVMSKGSIASVVNLDSVKVRFDKEWRRSDGVRVRQLSLHSPHAQLFPRQMPAQLGVVHARLYELPDNKRTDQLALHLAATGDHGYARREMGFVTGLAKTAGCASIVLQNPFYGERRPDHQFRSSLHNTADLFVMGAALIAECYTLIEWARRNLGYRRFCLSGVSLGGHMSCLAGSNLPFPSAIVPCMSATNAASVFTDGALAQAIQWERLGEQLKDREYISRINDVNGEWLDEAHESGKKNGKTLAYNLMQVLMTEFTSLASFSTPRQPSAATAVLAVKDAYVPTDAAPPLDQLWPGARIVQLHNEGHVSAYFRRHADFRREIVDALGRIDVK